jgi:putative ABC transport system substrate-binding protein
MKRREFITLLGGAAATWPLAARAQEPGRIYRVGGLHASPRDAPHHLALFDELRRLGFIDGQNLVVDAAGYGMSAERYIAWSVRQHYHVHQKTPAACFGMC